MSNYVINGATKKDSSLEDLHELYCTNPISFENIEEKNVAIFAIYQEQKENFNKDIILGEIMDIEMSLLNTISEMETTGVSVSKSFLSSLEKELEIKLLEMRKVIHTLAGQEFNIDSESNVILYRH